MSKNNSKLSHMYSSNCINWRGHKKKKLTNFRSANIMNTKCTILSSSLPFLLPITMKRGQFTTCFTIFDQNFLFFAFVWMFCRLTCDISGVTRKVLSFSLVLLMSSFRVVTMVVLLVPLLKIISHSFSCRTVIWKSQNVSKQLQSPFCDCN